MLHSANPNNPISQFKQSDVANYIKSLSGQLALMAKRVDLSELSEKLDACAVEANRLANDLSPPKP